MWNSAKINNNKTPKKQLKQINDDIAEQSTTGNGRSFGSPLASSTPKRLSADVLSTKQRRLEYLKNEVDADCEVHVPKTVEPDAQGGNVCYQKFRCHRVFLATASEKLEQDVLLNKQWNGVLQINGVSPESVAIFLEFIYTFEVTSENIDLKIIGDIFVLSYAYQLPELLSIFSQKLKETEWPLEDTFPAYDLAFRNGMIDLENSCLEKIVDNAQQLKSQENIMQLHIYAFNFVIQIWLATEALSTSELIQLMREYQVANDLNFKNSKQFPHFTKILKYFPDLLLNAEGLIHIT